jgi:hypothetical protein
MRTRHAIIAWVRFLEQSVGKQPPTVGSEQSAGNRGERRLEQSAGNGWLGTFHGTISGEWLSGKRFMAWNNQRGNGGGCSAGAINADGQVCRL